MSQTTERVENSYNPIGRGLTRRDFLRNAGLGLAGLALFPYPLSQRLGEVLEAKRVIPPAYLPPHTPNRQGRETGLALATPTAAALLPHHFIESGEGEGGPEILPMVTESYNAGFEFSPKGTEDVDSFQVEILVPDVLKDGKLGAEAVVVVGPQGIIYQTGSWNMLRAGVIVGGAETDYLITPFTQRLKNNSTTKQVYYFYYLGVRPNDHLLIEGRYTKDRSGLDYRLTNKRNERVVVSPTLNTEGVYTQYLRAAMQPGTTNGGTKAANFPTFTTPEPVTFSNIRVDRNVALEGWQVTPIAFQSWEEESNIISYFIPEQDPNLPGLIKLVDHSYPV